MSATLPVPIRFALPGPEWQPVPPESLGVRNAAFLAVRPDPQTGYAPIISISGAWREDPATLEEIAEESLALLRAQAEEVELVKRTRVGSDAAPAVTQSMGAVAVVEGVRRDLRQAQVLAAYLDVDDPRRRAVVIYTLTCTYAQFPTMGREFQQFMASVELVAPEESRTV